MKFLGRNWKTTLAGAIGAAVTVILPLATSGVVDPKTLGTAAALAAIGYLAKDAGVSGSEK